MTMDQSERPVVCAVCQREAPSGVEPSTEELHGLGWRFASSGPGWTCGECAPAESS